MSVSEQTTPSSDADRKARREELKRKWMEKRAAEEARRATDREESPIDKVIDTILAPTYVTIGAGIIGFRKLMGRPTVTVEDFE